MSDAHEAAGPQTRWVRCRQGVASWASWAENATMEQW
ncbi:hypothetical protein JO379_002564 [Streptomyces syringium]|uniref:Uncharacterized protein n=1 Tax=Streptomyces syringium TaxID=76729 RepID=A0ABS4Y381_9ACTN|nr:hypothetical protein [Streptomyces syringium]